MDETAARIVLYLYETKLTKTSDGVFNGGFNTYYAEQFMPRPCAAANDNWPAVADPDDERYRQQAISTLGNYFLLHICNEKGLKKYHNEGFDKKLGLIKKYCRDIRSGQILDSLREWNDTEITNRNNVLASGFCDRIWPLD